MATHASRDTITGLIFEKKVKPLVNNGGQDISKKRLKQFCADMGIGDIVQYLSWSFEPDIAYYDPHTKSVHIYEIKFQQTSGSADEKLGACAWKIEEYKSLFSAIGIYNVKYTYVFCDWFKQPRYVKLLQYIKRTPDCDYVFADEL
jgi:hypothetical protein